MGPDEGKGWKSARACALAMSAAAVGLAPIGAGRAAAEVISAAANGFEVRETAHIAAPPDKVYAALLLPARWWSSQHTFSGDAANLVLEPRAGGCWCETLPNGGSVEHLHVVYVAPGKALRLRGALGPFQAMAVEGAMTWSLAAAADGTDITMAYTIVGYGKDGFGELAKAADRVLGEASQSLKKLVEGAPPAPR
jgi:uncharacterized protein YndB with AHSA1/START domain